MISNVSVAFKATVSSASKCGGPASSHHKSKQGVKVAAAVKTSKQPPKVAAHIKRAYNTSITFLRNREVKVSRQALHAMIPRIYLHRIYTQLRQLRLNRSRIIRIFVYFVCMWDPISRRRK